MITLITFPPAFGEPCASSFCTKAVYMLNLAGLRWQREDTNDPRKWPKGKLPAVTVGDTVIGDSDGIRAHIEAQGVDLNDGLSDLDRGTARAFIRMAEEHLYFHMVMDRWGNDAVWPVVRDIYFKEIPKLPRLLVTRGLRKALMKGMHAQGLGRLTEVERLDRANQDLDAITARLWQGAFLFGDRPTLADASVAPVLGGLRATPVPTLLSKRVGEDAVLSAYIDRVNDALG